LTKRRPSAQIDVDSRVVQALRQETSPPARRTSGSNSTYPPLRQVFENLAGRPRKSPETQQRATGRGTFAPWRNGPSPPPARRRVAGKQQRAVLEEVCTDRPTRSRRVVHRASCRGAPPAAGQTPRRSSGRPGRRLQPGRPSRTVARRDRNGRSPAKMPPRDRARRQQVRHCRGRRGSGNGRTTRPGRT